MDAQRQKKVSALIQKELAALIAADLRRGGAANLLISVTQVRVASDFSVAKIYLSIFPSDKANERLEQLQKNSSKIRIRNRCEISGRRNGVYRKLKISRIALRDMASSGKIPGITKSSW